MYVALSLPPRLIGGKMGQGSCCSSHSPTSWMDCCQYSGSDAAVGLLLRLCSQTRGSPISMLLDASLTLFAKQPPAVAQVSDLCKNSCSSQGEFNLKHVYQTYKQRKGLTAIFPSLEAVLLLQTLQQCKLAARHMLLKAWLHADHTIHRPKALAAQLPEQPSLPGAVGFLQPPSTVQFVMDRCPQQEAALRLAKSSKSLFASVLLRLPPPWTEILWQSSAIWLQELRRLCEP